MPPYNELLLVIGNQLLVEFVFGKHLAAALKNSYPNINQFQFHQLQKFFDFNKSDMKFNSSLKSS